MAEDMHMDIIERLARLETKLDSMSGARDIAIAASTKADENTRRLDKIDRLVFWFGTVVIGAVVLQVFDIVWGVNT